MKFKFRTSFQQIDTIKFQSREGAAIAEERAFLKGYTIPFVQLDPLKSILVFSLTVKFES